MEEINNLLIARVEGDIDENAIVCNNIDMSTTFSGLQTDINRMIIKHKSIIKELSKYAAV